METVGTYTTAIVIPCYNEYARLSVDSFMDHLKLHTQHAFCFVNDGSTDKTIDLLNILKATCSNAYVLDLEENVGKAMAVYHGIHFSIKNIEAQYYGYMDADLATPLSFVSMMEAELKQHAELSMIFGSRQLADEGAIERKVFRHYSGRLVSGIITWALGQKYGDTQCGAKLFSKEGVLMGFQKPFISSWVFDVEIIKRLLVNYGKEEAKKKISEIPVNQWKDVGNSKVSPLYFFKMCGELLKIKKMN